VDDRPDLLERLRAGDAAAAVLDAAARHEGVHVVGGAVRDALLGGAPRDLDFAVEGDAGAVAAAVARELAGEVTEHDRFGTARVTAGGRAYDFARTRSETYLHSGALPDVAPARLEDDLGRRDFTVNAFAVSVGPPQPGRLAAAPHAGEDLQAGRLRVLHDESFRDDPTRLFRLARYAARLGFAAEARTAALARAAITDGAVFTISGPRVGQELRLAAREADPVAAFAELEEMGLRTVDRESGFDAAWAARAVGLLPDDHRRDRVVLAASARDLDSEHAEAVAARFGLDRDETRLVVAVTRRLPDLAARLAGVERPSAIDALLAGSTPEEAALIGALGPEVPVRRWLGELRDARLEIAGDDLRAAGAPEGPGIGAGLAGARAGLLDGELSTREDQLAAALRIAAG
jgi:tRNA nucleotidyltransferase (CCA-adding enzyme)